MVSITSHAFRDFLIQSFPQPKPHEPGTGLCLKIDDRSSGDKSGAFCTIYLSDAIRQPGFFCLTLKNVPYDRKVEELVTKYQGEWTGPELQKTLVIPIRKSSGPYLSQLATAIRRVVGKGRRYDPRDWKWIAPRTADSVGRLAECLKAYHRQKKTVNNPKKVVALSNPGNRPKSQIRPTATSLQNTSLLDDGDLFVSLGIE